MKIKGLEDVEEWQSASLDAPEGSPPAEPDASPILIVDDSPSSRALLGRWLREWGHEVLVASSGDEAWKILQSRPVSFVITDWMMPGLAGPELCRRIRGLSGRRYTYVILLSAKTARQERVEALDAGADDFLSKPFDPGELRGRIRAGERILALEKRLARRSRLLARSHARLLQAHQRLERDLEAAARAQVKLLPGARRSVHGWRFSSLFIPSSYVSGDLFDYFALDESHVGFYHFDVAGHGVSAALLSVVLNHELTPRPSLGSPLKTRSSASRGYRITPPQEVLSGLNERYQDAADGSAYFTIIYGILDAASGVCELSQGGHPNPVHLRRGQEPLLLGGGSYPVGLLPEATHDSLRFTLSAGDRLVLYSDGVTDCCSPDGERFGTERLLAALDGTEGESLSSLTGALEDRLRAWRGSRLFDDDVSVLALEAPHGRSRQGD